MFFLPLQFSSPASLIRFFIYIILPTLFLPSVVDVKILSPTVFHLIFFSTINAFSHCIRSSTINTRRILNDVAPICLLS
ncbi:hypothetical protein Hanom_Chr02g00145591 [Helianthus anomalus]